MSTKDIKMSGAETEGLSPKEVGRIEVGRYVRLYDLSGAAPKLVFELRERPLPEGLDEGPTAEDHATAIIDFFERLARGEVSGGK